MVYIFGFIGFALGFSIGLGAINVLLRHLSTKDIEGDASLRWTYGVGVWILGGLGGWFGLWIYETYFI